MTRTSNRTTAKSHYSKKSYKVNASKTNSYFPARLQKQIRQLEIHNDRWGRTLFIRCDLHSTIDHVDDNKKISAFVSNLKKKLKSKLGFEDVGFSWAKENHGNAKHDHYHFALYLNGNIERTSRKIKPIIRSCWDDEAKGYTSHFRGLNTSDDPENRHFLLIESQHQLEDGVYWLSYLAKTRGKKKGAKHSFGNSRLIPPPPPLTESDLEPLKLEEQQIIPEIAGTSLKPPSAAFKRINHYNDHFKQNSLQGMTEYEIDEFCQLFEQCGHPNKNQEVKEEISILFGFFQPLADINTFIINELQSAQN